MVEINFLYFIVLLSLHTAFIFPPATLSSTRIFCHLRCLFSTSHLCLHNSSLLTVLSCVLSPAVPVNVRYSGSPASAVFCLMCLLCIILNTQHDFFFFLFQWSSSLLSAWWVNLRYLTTHAFVFPLHTATPHPVSPHYLYHR